MSQVLRTNGDYNIITRESGTITLDTGLGLGFVRVTGNLIVEGDTLTVEATNLNVEDNILTLNYYGADRTSVPAGIVLDRSGIKIDRGSLPAVNIIYDETDDVWLFASGDSDTGIFDYDGSAIRTQKILTNSDTVLASTSRTGDLNLIGTGTGVVTVIGTTDYELQVTLDDDIPNKKYVDDAIQTNPTFQIRSPGLGTASDTRVVAFDEDASYPASAFPMADGRYTEINQTSSNFDSHIAIIVDDRRVAAFTTDGLVMRGIEIYAEEPVGTDIFGSPTSEAVTIKAVDANADLRLETNSLGTGKVVVPYALQIDNNGITPGSVTGSTILYGGDVLGGKSGIYVINDSIVHPDGELVTKNRAILFGMIF